MAGLTLTRKRGQHIALTVQRGDKTVVIAVITLSDVGIGCARLKILADPEIGIGRCDGEIGKDAGS